MIGAGDRVVGVTRYCTYPEQALAKAKVGGYVDPSVEAVCALRPELVIMLAEQARYLSCLDTIGVKALAVDHATPQGILDSILEIGRACGETRRAQQAVAALRSRMEAVRSRTGTGPHPRVLVTVGRTISPGGISDVFAAGKSSFHDELIALAGGINALDRPPAYPMVTAEGVMRMNPDIVIDLVPDTDARPGTEAEVTAAWRKFAGVRAVKTGRIHVIVGSHTVVTGPRFIELLEDMARIIHPEAGLP